MRKTTHKQIETIPLLKLLIKYRILHSILYGLLNKRKIILNGRYHERNKLNEMQNSNKIKRNLITYTLYMQRIILYVFF